MASSGFQQIPNPAQNFLRSIDRLSNLHNRIMLESALVVDGAVRTHFRVLST